MVNLINQFTMPSVLLLSPCPHLTFKMGEKNEGRENDDDNNNNKGRD